MRALTNKKRRGRPCSRKGTFQATSKSYSLRTRSQTAQSEDPELDRIIRNYQSSERLLNREKMRNTLFHARFKTQFYQIRKERIFTEVKLESEQNMYAEMRIAEKKSHLTHMKATKSRLTDLDDQEEASIVVLQEKLHFIDVKMQALIDEKTQASARLLIFQKQYFEAKELLNEKKKENNL